MTSACAPASRHAALLALLCAPLILAAPPADAAEKLSFCFVNWNPYEATVDGKPAGISIDILAEAAKRAGIEASFQELPWKRCLQNVLDGEQDVAMDGTARAEYWHGTNSHTSSYYVFFVSKDSAVDKFSGVGQFAGKTVSLIQGWWYPDAMTHAQDIKIDQLTSEKAQAQSLVLHRQDAAFGDLITLGQSAKEAGAAIRPLSPMLEEVRFYPLFNKKRQAAGEAIDKALGTMLADGTVDKIYQSHLGVTFSGLRDIATGHATAKTN